MYKLEVIKAIYKLIPSPAYSEEEYINAVHEELPRLFTTEVPSSLEWIVDVVRSKDATVDIRFYSGTEVPHYLGNSLFNLGGALVMGDNRKATIIFNVDIMKYKNINTLALIYHELCHLKQFQDGRLDGTVEGNIWDGTLYPPRTYNSNEELIEHQLTEWPWEIEAYALTFKMIGREAINLLGFTNKDFIRNFYDSIDMDAIII